MGDLLSIAVVTVGLSTLVVAMFNHLSRAYKSSFPLLITSSRGEGESLEKCICGHESYRHDQNDPGYCHVKDCHACEAYGFRPASELIDDDPLLVEFQKLENEVEQRRQREIFKADRKSGSARSAPCGCPMFETPTGGYETAHVTGLCKGTREMSLEQQLEWVQAKERAFWTNTQTGGDN